MISNPNIDSIFEEALDNGATGGKLLGAGAGGFLMFLVARHKQKKFFKKMNKYICLPIKFDKYGSSILNIKK